MPGNGRHIRTELGQGFYGMVLTDGANQTFPHQPEHATDRKYFHFKEGFEKCDIKKYPMHRPKKVKDLLPIDQWSSRASKPEFTFFVHAYTTEPGQLKVQRE